MGRGSEIVGKKLEPLFLLHVQIGDAAKRIRINGSGLKRCQDDGVIRTNTGALIDLVGVAALQQDVGFGAHYEEGGTEREEEEALEIHIGAVHDIESTGLRHDLVQDVYVVHSALGNANKRGDIATQVQQGVHLDGGFVFAKLRPRK